MPSSTLASGRSILALGLLFSGVRGVADVCSKPPQQHGLVVVHEETVSINTEVLWNTTFYAAPGLAMTVTNAPTSLDLVTTFRWTDSTLPYTSQGLSPSTASMPPTFPVVASPTASPLQDTGYIMEVLGINLDKKLRKRQSGSVYINAAGAITNDCTASPIYTIANGQLTATANSLVYYYSTSPNLAYTLFVPSVTPGAIATTFSVGGGGALVWSNDAFYNGQASFCALSNGTIYATFQENGQPDGCLYIQLNMFSASSCQGLQLSTITGPTGPAGATDK